MCNPLDIIFFGNLWSHMNFPCHVYDMVMSKKCNQMANFPGFSANSMKTNDQVRLVCFHSVCRRSWKVFWTSKSWSDVQAHFFFFITTETILPTPVVCHCGSRFHEKVFSELFHYQSWRLMWLMFQILSRVFFFFRAQVSRFVFWFFMHLHTI